MRKKQTKGRVFVGLSGGVDSSVSAALLQAAGYDVTGVFIKVWQPDFWGGCTLKADRLDAMRVCAKLAIPFQTLDLEKEYKKEVVDYMIREYKAGRTPNPDVMCNKYVKFGGFFDWAMKHGADYVATGHYARVESRISNIEYRKETDKFQILNSKFNLLAGVDTNKDQTYFLWTLTQKQLARTLFPVGNKKKPAVRKLAKKFGLDTATKKDSQGLCFIGQVEMSEFLRHFLKPKPGVVLNENGEVIGTHAGVELYTIGQRHGFVIEKKTALAERNFIIKKDLKNNTLTVSPNPLPIVEKASREIKIKQVSWTAGQAPDLTRKYSARIRYRQPLEKCSLQGSTLPGQIRQAGLPLLTVVFDRPQKAVTPGQSLVIYDGDVCLGGGIIV